MTAPVPDPWPAPDPTPYPSPPDPAPRPDEAPVHIINLPPDTVPPGVTIDNPERGDRLGTACRRRTRMNADD